jgi:hypothetical protein
VRGVPTDAGYWIVQGGRDRLAGASVRDVIKDLHTPPSDTRTLIAEAFD